MPSLSVKVIAGQAVRATPGAVSTVVVSSGVSTFAITAVDASPLLAELKGPLSFVAGAVANPQTLGLLRTLPTRSILNRATQQLSQYTQGLRVVNRAAGLAPSIWQPIRQVLQQRVVQLTQQVRQLRIIGGPALQAAEGLYGTALTAMRKVTSHLNAPGLSRAGRALLKKSQEWIGKVRDLAKRTKEVAGVQDNVARQGLAQGVVPKTPIPGDADFVGPIASGGRRLGPRGMGRHLVERQNVARRPA